MSLLGRYHWKPCVIQESQTQAAVNHVIKLSRSDIIFLTSKFDPMVEIWIITDAKFSYGVELDIH